MSSQGVHWVHVHPQGGEKMGPNLQGKVVSAPPRQSKSHYYTLYFVIFCRFKSNDDDGGYNDIITTYIVSR